MSVYYDQHYIGHVLARGHEGFEAYDHNKQSLGAFKTRRRGRHGNLESSAMSAFSGIDNLVKTVTEKFIDAR